MRHWRRPSVAAAATTEAAWLEPRPEKLPPAPTKNEGRSGFLASATARASSSVLAGLRAQILLISAIQSAAEAVPVLGPWHNRLNASCVSVPLLAAVAEVNSPAFITLFRVGKPIPGMGSEPA